MDQNHDDFLPEDTSMQRILCGEVSLTSSQVIVEIGDGRMEVHRVSPTKPSSRPPSPQPLVDGWVARRVVDQVKNHVAGGEALARAAREVLAMRGAGDRSLDAGDAAAAAATLSTPVKAPQAFVHETPISAGPAHAIEPETPHPPPPPPPPPHGAVAAVAAVAAAGSLSTVDRVLANLLATPTTATTSAARRREAHSESDDDDAIKRKRVVSTPGRRVLLDDDDESASPRAARSKRQRLSDDKGKEVDKRKIKVPVSARPPGSPLIAPGGLKVVSPGRIIVIPGSSAEAKKKKRLSRVAQWAAAFDSHRASLATPGAEAPAPAAAAPTAITLQSGRRAPADLRRAAKETIARIVDETLVNQDGDIAPRLQAAPRWVSQEVSFSLLLKKGYPDSSEVSTTQSTESSTTAAPEAATTRSRPSKKPPQRKRNPSSSASSSSSSSASSSSSHQSLDSLDFNAKRESTSAIASSGVLSTSRKSAIARMRDKVMQDKSSVVRDLFSEFIEDQSKAAALATTAAEAARMANEARQEAAKGAMASASAAAAELVALLGKTEATDSDEDQGFDVGDLCKEVDAPLW